MLFFVVLFIVFTAFIVFESQHFRFKCAQSRAIMISDHLSWLRSERERFITTCQAMGVIPSAEHLCLIDGFISTNEENLVKIRGDLWFRWQRTTIDQIISEGKENNDKSNHQ